MARHLNGGRGLPKCAKIALIPDGTYHGEAWVDSDGVVDEPLRIARNIEKKQDSDLYFDFDGSSPSRKARQQCVLAITWFVCVSGHEAYFPGCTDQLRERLDPLHIKDPDDFPICDAFLARFPGAPQSLATDRRGGLCSACRASAQYRHRCSQPALAVTLSLGGYDPEKDRPFVMYQISGQDMAVTHRRDG